MANLTHQLCRKARKIRKHHDTRNDKTSLLKRFVISLPSKIQNEWLVVAASSKMQVQALPMTRQGGKESYLKAFNKNGTSLAKIEGKSRSIDDIVADVQPAI